MFECDDKTCETIEELQTIGGKTRNFEINFSLQGVSHELNIHGSLVYWRFYGLTTEGGWNTHRKLTTVFESRRVKWKTFYRAIPIWAPALLGGPLGFALSSILRKRNLAEALAFGLILLLWIFSGIAYLRPTVVFLRPSIESSGFRELIKRSAPQIIAALIGVGATLLAVYLRHKIWP